MKYAGKIGVTVWYVFFGRSWDVRVFNPFCQGSLDVWVFLKSSGSLFHKRTAIAGKEFEVVERRHFNGLIWPCELERVLMFDLRSTFIISIVCGRVSNWRAFLNSIIIACVY